MKVYGLPEGGQGLERRNDMARARAAGEGHIILPGQRLARGQSINLHQSRS